MERAVDLFQIDCYWRDLVTFTWNIKTMEGKDQVRAMLKARLADTKPSNWAIAEGEDATEADGVIESWIQFETDLARGFGHMRLKDGKIWTLLTTMAELKGHEEAQGFDRPMGVKHGADRNRVTWKEGARRKPLNWASPASLIASSSAAGRAASRSARGYASSTCRPSSSRRTNGRATAGARRYKSLCLHDPVWYDHLPYLPFPKNWPVFSPKDKIGDWLEMYTKVMELNYWSSTTCKKATYDEKAKEWTVVVERDGKGNHPQTEAACARHRHVRQGQYAEVRGHGCIQGRPAPFIAASGAGQI